MCYNIKTWTLWSNILSYSRAISLIKLKCHGFHNTELCVTLLLEKTD